MYEIHKVYYKDSVIEEKHAAALGKKIMHLNLRIGDKFRSFPFSEDGKTKEPAYYQGIYLVIKDIDIRITDTLDRCVETEIHISLDKYKST